MTLDGGRGQLYSAFKTLQAHWELTQPYWQDVMRLQFIEQIWTPLEEQTARALEAVDQLSVILSQMRRDCEGNTYDIFGGD